MDFFEKFSAWLPELDREQKEKLSLLFQALVEVAQPAGYIGSAEPEALFVRHILDSLLVATSKEGQQLFTAQSQIADLGTGAGLPGLPLAILYPHCNFALVDSAGPRIDFISQMTQTLGLANVQTFHLALDKESEGQKVPPCDLVIYRAFRRPLASLELAVHVLKKNGKVLYYRSRPFDVSTPENQLTSEKEKQIHQRILALGFSEARFYRLNSPAEAGSRGFYLFSFNGKKENGFPRRWKKIQNDELVKEVT